MKQISARRIWMITDTHLGVRSNSREWMTIIEEFFKNQLFPTLREHGRPGDILVHCGDTFDSRQSINLYVMNKGLDIFEELASIMPVYTIVGNHDIFMKYSNEINSMKLFKHLPNIHVYEEPVTLKSTETEKTLFFLPWVEDHDELVSIIQNPLNFADVLFCHTDVKGVSFNRHVKIEEGAEAESFSGYHRVYSGHIHYSQKYKNVRMLGTPYQLTRSDSGNTKAIWLLDLETDEERCWENTVSPKFLRYRLEWVLEQKIEDLQDLFYNNFVDILITPEWSLKFPFGQFIENFTGYRRINHIIVSEDSLGDESEDNEAEGYVSEEITLVKFIENYVNGLPYPSHLKEKITEVSKRFYNETLKELEEKRTYENT